MNSNATLFAIGMVALVFAIVQPGAAQSRHLIRVSGSATATANHFLVVRDASSPIGAFVQSTSRTGLGTGGSPPTLAETFTVNAGDTFGAVVSALTNAWDDNAGSGVSLATTPPTAGSIELQFFDVNSRPLQFYVGVLGGGTTRLDGIGTTVQGTTYRLSSLPQPNLPTATLFVSGNDPTLASGNDVSVVLPGFIQLDHRSSNPNAPIVVTADITTDPIVGRTTLQSPLPWGDFYDLGVPNGTNLPTGPAIIGNGFSPGSFSGLVFRTDGGPGGATPRFLWTIGGPASLHAQQIAVQSVFFDPTNPPINLRNSAAASLDLRAGQCLVLVTGDDGVVNVPFVPGNSFPFHGASYTSVTVSANGFVTFDSPSSLAGAGFSIPAAQWVAAEPSIAGSIADWNPTMFAPTDGVLYEEDGATLSIAWGDPLTNSGGGVVAGLGGLSGGQFAIELDLDSTNPALVTAAGGTLFNAGTFRLVVDNLFATGFSPDASLFGHTPGTTSTAAGAVSLDVNSAVDTLLHGDTGGTGGPGQAQVEEHDPAGTNASILGAAGNGNVRRLYGRASIWSGNTVEFTPLGPAGGSGYAHQFTGTIPNDLRSITPTTALPGIAQAVTLIGKFHNFDASVGTVDFVDPTGTVTVGTVIGVMNNGGVTTPAATTDLPNPFPSPLRDGEGLVVMPPPLPPGSMMVRLDRDGDGIIDGTVPLAVSVAVTTTIPLTDDGFASFSTMPITLYGNTYTSLFMSSNGIISFIQGTNAFTSSVAAFDQGWQGLGAGPNPSIALAAHDMNRGGMMSGASYQVIADLTTGSTAVNYLNQNHWMGGEPAGNFSVSFDGATFTFDYSAFIPAMTDTGLTFYGITDGDETTGAVTDLSAAPNGLLGYSSSGSGSSLPDSPFVQAPANVPHVGSGFLPGDYNGTGVSFALEPGVGDWIIF